ncbi:tetratricopeptide repeat protein [Carboxylicivirga sp. RSCT41]|uniref:tetratricopeptide repeat protein n=1 Tax=Carboxylicivirga agarovorans TaxID=3417570 RepID=UPI003D356C38
MRSITCSILILSLFGFSAMTQDQLKIDSLQVSYQFADSDTQKINLLWEMAEQYMTNDYSKALNKHQQALEIATTIDNEYRIAKSNMLIGKVHALSGDYDDALKNAMLGINTFKKQEKHFELYECNILIGIVHDRIAKYDDALKYYFNAINIANKIKTSNTSTKNLREHVLYNNIGNIYFAKKEYDKSIEYYDQAIQSAKSNKDLINLAVHYNNKGRVFDRIKDYEPAQKFLHLGLDTRIEIKDKAGMAKSHYFLCAHYMKLMDFDKALNHAHQSLKLGKEVGSIQTQYNAIYFLYEINYKKGNFKKAADLHVDYKQLSDSMYNSQTMNEITRLKMQADFNDKEAQRKLTVQRTQFQYAAVVIILISCLIVMVFVYMLLKAKAKGIKVENDGLEKDIELKNKELATNVMYMVRKNEMINGVAKKLLELKKQSKDENKRSIQNIIIELQAEVDKNVWKEFELRFQNVHNEFYEQLAERHPDLSPNESRLVAFLRLNMTTKEIAAITHQNIKSVEVARARLRKKLNLTGTDTNLVTYLNSF